MRILFDTMPVEPITAALERHLAWQQRLPEQTRARGALPKAVNFLLLRPGDKLTVCAAAQLPARRLLPRGRRREVARARTDHDARGVPAAPVSAPPC